MLDTINRQKLFFISLIGIVVVSLVMITTYAYQTLQVEYKDNSKEDLTVNAGVLDVTYTKTKTIEINNMPLLPNYKTADYLEFTLDNTKSTSNVAYNITLKNIEYLSSMASEDFKYTIVDATDSKNIPLTTGDFKDLNGDTFMLYNTTGMFDFIDQGKIKKIRIYLWLKNSDEDQSKFENKTNSPSFKANVEVTSIFVSDINDTSLNYNIYKNNNSYLNTKNDNYGLSYYYINNPTNNYINIDNMCYRIVRILGNGNIKLVLEDKSNTCETSKSNDYIVDTLDNFYNSITSKKILVNNEWCSDTINKYDVNTFNPTNGTDNYLYEGALKISNNEFNFECSVTNKTNVSLLSIDEILSSNLKENQPSYLKGTSPYTLLNKYGVISGVEKNIVIDNDKVIESELTSLRPSIVINKNLNVTGNGTYEDPYKIN